MNTITFSKIPALAVVSLLSFVTGCTTYGGENNANTNSASVGTSLSTLGEIIGDIGSVVSPRSANVWRQSSAVLNSTGRTLSVHEANAERQQAYLEQQRKLQAQEQESQALAGISPEQRSPYTQDKQSYQAERNEQMAGLTGVPVPSSTGAKSIGERDEELIMCDIYMEKDKNYDKSDNKLSDARYHVYYDISAFYERHEYQDQELIELDKKYNTAADSDFKSDPKRFSTIVNSCYQNH